MRVFIVALVIIFQLDTTVFAQQNSSSLNFSFLFGGEKLVLGHRYFSSALQDSVSFKTVELYISSPEVWIDSIWLKVDSSSHHLLNIEKPSSLHFPLLNFGNVQKFRFQLGVDSTTSVSGAFGGGLDPLNGMYWSWQSGYINIKIEGTSAAFDTRKNAFQYHIGGYNGSFNALQEVELQAAEQENYVIELDLEAFLASTKKLPGDLSSIMSPGKDAVTLSKQIATLFKLVK